MLSRATTSQRFAAQYVSDAFRGRVLKLASASDVLDLADKHIKALTPFDLSEVVKSLAKKREEYVMFTYTCCSFPKCSQFGKCFTKTR